MLTEQDRALHKQYENDVQQCHTRATAADEAFDAVAAVLADYGLKAKNDDPAEALVAALHRFIVESEAA